LTRVVYNREWEIPLTVDETNAVVRSIVYRLHIENGRLVRFALALRVRDERDNQLKDILRYDDYRGIDNRLEDIVRYDHYRGFHRHAPGSSSGSSHDRIVADPGCGLAFDEAALLEADLLENAERYEAEARKSGFEVPDDELETDS
jgi:hypothetical protein